MDGPTPRIAYFSMEIGLDDSIPTYAGGLGILAGDTIRAAADMGLPMVGVTLLYRDGYFAQRLDDAGRQAEEPQRWAVEDHLHLLPVRVAVRIEGRDVVIAAWRRAVVGVGGRVAPVIFLDTNLPENSPEDRAITASLYAGDLRHRLRQEMVLGIGGVRALRALGCYELACFHMNEGHAALLTFELLREAAASEGRTSLEPHDPDRVRRSCVFTTHTPVAAGHDSFPYDLACGVIGEHPALERFLHEGRLNMTRLALALSRWVNGVSRRHAEVSRLMFAPREVESITNGVHAATWAASPMRALFDAHVPGWRADNSLLRQALAIPRAPLADARAAAKARLIEEVESRTGRRLDPRALTIGFARRATGYKRPELVLSDPGRLRRIASEHGPIQLVFSGKAHPHDHQGKELIARVHDAARELGDEVPVVYLPAYSIALASRIVAGVDVWLNTPMPPLEASGTSGMKAALNGVPSLSVLDGWWVEGCVEGVTGWAIGPDTDARAADRSGDAEFLYHALETMVAPAYKDPDRWAAIMRHAIAINGAWFTTQRMLWEYAARVY